MKRLARFAKKAYEPPLAECRSAHVGAKYESSILAKLNSDHIYCRYWAGLIYQNIWAAGDEHVTKMALKLTGEFSVRR